jgi:hypothetical protein
LPAGWAEILEASGVPKDVINSHPQTVRKIMQLRMPGSLQQQQQRPKQSTTSSNDKGAADSKDMTSASSVDESNKDENPPQPSISKMKSRTSSLPFGFAPPSRSRSSRLTKKQSINDLKATDNTDDTSYLSVSPDSPLESPVLVDLDINPSPIDISKEATLSIEIKCNSETLKNTEPEGDVALDSSKLGML